MEFASASQTSKPDAMAKPFKLVQMALGAINKLAKWRAKEANASAHQKARSSALDKTRRHVRKANGIPPIALWDAMTACVMHAHLARINAITI